MIFVGVCFEPVGLDLPDRQQDAGNGHEDRYPQQSRPLHAPCVGLLPCATLRQGSIHDVVPCIRACVRSMALMLPFSLG